MWMPAAGGGGGGNVSVNSGSPGTYAWPGAGTSLNYTGLTIAAGTNRLLVVGVAWDIGEGTTTPTSLAMTWPKAATPTGLTRQVFHSLSTPNGAQTELWTLTNPDTGNNTLAMTWSGSQRIVVVGMCFDNVDQSTPIAHTASAEFGASNVTITSAVGNMVMAIASSGSAFASITGTTIFSDTVSGSFINSFSNRDVGAASVVIGNSIAITNISAVDIKKA